MKVILYNIDLKVQRKFFKTPILLNIGKIIWNIEEVCAGFILCYKAIRKIGCIAVNAKRKLNKEKIAELANIKEILPQNFFTKDIVDKVKPRFRGEFKNFCYDIEHFECLNTKKCLKKRKPFRKRNFYVV